MNIKVNISCTKEGLCGAQEIEISFHERYNITLDGRCKFCNVNLIKLFKEEDKKEFKITYEKVV